jgi:hypothetical protein
MLFTYEVRQYDISKMINIIEYVNTPKEVYKLLTREELLNPHCVYENLTKKDKYIGIDIDCIIERIKRMNEDEEDETDETNETFLCVKVKINIKTKKEKILDYWFE